jgi:protein-S-isoprenylcysteine O-methyltransferase Ste14
MKSSALFVTVVPLIGIPIVLWAFNDRPWTVMHTVGFCITIASLAVLTIARINLGNSFSIAPEAHALVTKGIYSRIRHPVYIFGMLLLSGLALYANLPWLLLLFLPIGFMQLKRARAEENVLQQAFGEEYTRYKSKTWF